MTQTTTHVKTTKQTRRLPLGLLILTGLLLLLIWAGVKGWRVYRATQSLLEQQAQIETWAAGGLESVTAVPPDKIEATVLGIRSNFLTIKRETAFLLPLLPHLDWLPRVGSTFAVAPELVIMADAGTETAVLLVQGFRPALEQFHTGITPTISELVQFVDGATPQLIQAQQELDRIVAARAAIGNPNELPWRLRTLLDLADEWLPLAQDGLVIVPHLPEIMGASGQRRYILVAQNRDELRATGGFISGVGLLIVNDGQIVDLNFEDSAKLDNWREKPYDFPPQPLYDFMGLELFLIRDANFWPDFPTSAEKIIELHSYSLDVPPADGVIAIDQEFLRLLVEATGPISIPDQEQQITAANLLDSLQVAWSIQEDQEVGEWIRNRKAFLGTFAAAILQRIQSDFTQIDPALLLKNTFHALHTKHLQIYLRDPEVGSVLQTLDWDGRFPTTPDADFIAVVNTNMGYNKTNRLIDAAIDYQVQLRNDSPPQASLRIRYQHSGSPIGEPCVHGISYTREIGADYENLVNDCYWNYVRLYTPLGSHLLQSSRHTVPATAMITDRAWDNTAQQVNDLAQLTTFANFFMLPRSKSETVHFNYQLPTTVVTSQEQRNQYRLTVFKQAGSDSSPVTVSVSLPDNTTLLQADPQPTSRDGKSLHFEFNLEADTVITISYR